jgi:hypothetical protein
MNNFGLPIRDGWRGLLVPEVFVLELQMVFLQNCQVLFFEGSGAVMLGLMLDVIYRARQVRNAERGRRRTLVAS